MNIFHLSGDILQSVNILNGVQLATIKIKNHISVVLYSIFLLLHPKDTFNLSIATFYCLMELMDIWNSSLKITILFHFGSVKLLFIRKSIMNWPGHKRDIIGSHCQNVQIEVSVWSRVLTVPSRFHFHLFILLQLYFLCFSCILRYLSSQGNKWLQELQPKSFLVHIQQKKEIPFPGRSYAIGKTWTYGHLWTNHCVLE